MLSGGVSEYHVFFNIFFYISDTVVTALLLLDSLFG